MANSWSSLVNSVKFFLSFDFYFYKQLLLMVSTYGGSRIHIYVPYPFVAIPVCFSMAKRSVDNCNFFKINQEEYTSPMHY